VPSASDRCSLTFSADRCVGPLGISCGSIVPTLLLLSGHGTTLPWKPVILMAQADMQPAGLPCSLRYEGSRMRHPWHLDVADPWLDGGAIRTVRMTGAQDGRETAASLGPTALVDPAG